LLCYYITPDDISLLTPFTLVFHCRHIDTFDTDTPLIFSYRDAIIAMLILPHYFIARRQTPRLRHIERHITPYFARQLFAIRCHYSYAITPPLSAPPLRLRQLTPSPLSGCAYLITITTADCHMPRRHDYAAFADAAPLLIGFRCLS